MKKNGITAYKLASDIGVSSGNISDWKSGKYLPSRNALEKLCEYFNVPLSYFYIEQSTNYQPEIQNIFNQLTPDYQQELLERANLLLDEQNLKLGIAKKDII